MMMMYADEISLATYASPGGIAAYLFGHAMNYSISSEIAWALHYKDIIRFF